LWPRADLRADDWPSRPFIAAEYAFWAPLAKAAGLKIQ
jgi:hypothetical protein